MGKLLPRGVSAGAVRGIQGIRNRTRTSRRRDKGVLRGQNRDHQGSTEEFLNNVIDVLGWLGYSQIYYFALIFKLIVFLITDIGSHYLSVNRVMKFDAISDDYFFFPCWFIWRVY